MTRIWIVLGCALLLLAGVRALPAEAGATGSRWSLGPDDFVHYEIDVLAWRDSLYERRSPWGQIDSIAGFHGYELDKAQRRLERDVTHAELLYAPFVFTLPDRLVPGAKVEFRETLGGNWRLRAFRARGRVEVSAEPQAGGLVLLEGDASFLRSADPGELAYWQLDEGRLTWKTLFDPVRGVATKVEYELSWTTSEGTRERPSSAHSIRAEARSRETRVRLTLDRVFTYRYRGFQRDVDRAIKDGTAYLLAQQRRDGSWGHFGESALVLLALVDGGVAPDHPAVERGFGQLLRQQPWTGELRRRAVYGMSVALMAIERRRTPEVEIERRRKGLPTEFLRRRLTGLERAWMSRCVGFLIDEVKIERPGGDRRGPVTGTLTQERWRWGYGQIGREQYWDNSNSQYAVLGLESAARCNVPVPRRAWFGVANHFLHVQAPQGRDRLDLVIEHHGKEEPGRAGTAPATRSRTRARLKTRSRGWVYNLPPARDPGQPPTGCTYGAMTAAGIGSLAIARTRIADGPHARHHRKLLEEIDQAILDGYSSLDDMFTVWMHPRYEGWYTYYLYGLERAGMLTSVERFGGHDWYWEGAMQLLNRQSTYGHGTHRYWSYDFAHGGTTAWAILFLKRGTPPVVTPR